MSNKNSLANTLIGLLAIGIIGGVIAFVINYTSSRRGPPSPAGPGAGPGPGLGRELEELKGPQKGLRVLFIGNSHTFTHDLPGMVTRLSAAEERPVLAYTEAPGGTSFRMHWENGRVQQLLEAVKWDLVVLQDQSAMPTFSRQQRQAETLPYARQLHARIKESGAHTVLFMTWGYRDTFLPMQQMARKAYEELAADLGADVVPVGTAWEMAYRARPSLPLWGPDGNHADKRGTYLAACTFHAAFYGKSPAGNPFTAGLDPAEARFLQETATRAVELRPGGLAAKVDRQKGQ